MKHDIRISKEARRDLGAAYDYIAQDSIDRAEHWLAAMHAAISSLAEFPGRCPAALEGAESLPDLRQLAVLGYRIIFHIVEPRVLILHIRHASRAPAPIEEMQQDE